MTGEALVGWQTLEGAATRIVWRHTTAAMRRGRAFCGRTYLLGQDLQGPTFEGRKRALKAFAAKPRADLENIGSFGNWACNERIGPGGSGA